MTPTFNRREFLQRSSAATLAALAAGAPVSSLLSGCNRNAPGRTSGTADTVILLWMAGGMAHTETFDPKRYTPFEKDMEGNRVLSTFPSVPTALDGIHFSEGLESIGKVMDKGTLIRSYVAADLGHILHLAAPVQLAHLLRAAPNRGRAAHRGVDCQGTWPEKSGDSGLCGHRAAVHRRRSRGIESLPHGGFLGQ